MATKAEVIARLTELGVEHDPSTTKAALEDLLPADNQPGTPESTAVIVCDPQKHPHRTYSLELHGENFRALAEQYVSKRPGWSLKG